MFDKILQVSSWNRADWSYFILCLLSFAVMLGMVIHYARHRHGKKSDDS